MSTAARRNRRAPRLGPDEFIAPHITRLGRFRKVNPLKPRKLPKFSKVLGVVGWAVLLEESLRRARKAGQVDVGAENVTAPAAAGQTPQESRPRV